MEVESCVKKYSLAQKLLYNKATWLPASRVLSPDFIIHGELEI